MSNETKLVQVELAALTRVCWGALVRVPAHFGDEELAEVAERFYQEIDGGEYQDDTEFWDKGTCYSTESITISAEKKPAYSLDTDYQIKDLTEA